MGITEAYHRTGEINHNEAFVKSVVWCIEVAVSVFKKDCEGPATL